MNVEYKVEDQGPDAAKPMHFALAALISLPLASAGYVVDQAVRWTDHLKGLLNGLFHMVFLSMAWPIYLIPWCLIVYFCYRNRESKKNRTLWIMGPSIAMSLFTLAGLVFQPPNTARRFEAFTKVRFPENVTDLETYFSGGGVADYGDTYYFKVSTTEIDRLIREMNLEEVKYDGDPASLHTMVSSLPKNADLKESPWHRKYSGGRDNNHWFYVLLTDKEKTQVYIRVTCT